MEGEYDAPSSNGTPAPPYYQTETAPDSPCYHQIDPDMDKVKPPSERTLSKCATFSYGVGHVLNDLTASMWFSYLLVFLHQVRNFPNLLAGNLMLIGQVSDAVFTPFIGLESDRTKGIKGLGKRRTWHLVGTVCVMCSFPFLFIECITCANAPNLSQFVYYAPFVVIFQFGWASTQISHLSFANDCTPHVSERTLLQSIRNSFTVISNMAVYGIFILLFYIDGENGTNSDELTHKDAPTFRNLAFICVGLGTLFNFVFYFGTKEKASDSELEESYSRDQQGEYSIERSAMRKSKMKWKDWLKEHQFYQIALLYMSTRLYINVSQVYLPMFLTETVQLEKKSIAILPLVTYISSFVTSLFAPLFHKLLGRKASYLVGALVGIGSCVWYWFLGVRDSDVYACAVLMGASGSLLLITSISITSDLIKEDTESGAFVFGAMSFTDKLSNGVAVLLIQKFHPCVKEACCAACEPYYRHVQTLVPGAALCLGLVALCMLLPQTVGTRRKHAKLEVMVHPGRPQTPANPTTSTTSDNQSVLCSCGHTYSVLVSCPHCGQFLRPPSYSSDVEGDADSLVAATNEKSPLLRKSINTPVPYT